MAIMPQPFLLQGALTPNLNSAVFAFFVWFLWTGLKADDRLNIWKSICVLTVQGFYPINERKDLKQLCVVLVGLCVVA